MGQQMGPKTRDFWALRRQLMSGLPRRQTRCRHPLWKRLCGTLEFSSQKVRVRPLAGCIALLVCVHISETGGRRVRQGVITELSAVSSAWCADEWLHLHGSRDKPAPRCEIRTFGSVRLNVHTPDVSSVSLSNRLGEFTR